MLVVHLDTGGNTAAVVSNADGVVGVNGHHDVITVTGQRFIDGIVDYFKNQVVQAGTVGRIADVHARAFANGFQAFQNLN